MAGLGAGGAARSASAMLRALGGVQVKLLLPVASQADATQQELGLATPGLEEVAVGPAVVRNPWEGTPPRQTQYQGWWGAWITRSEQYEILISAEAVKAAAEAWQVGSGEELLRETRAVGYGGRQLKVMTVTTDYVGGVPYLYRILAAEQSDASGEG